MIKNHQKAYDRINILTNESMELAAVANLIGQGNTGLPVLFRISDGVSAKVSRVDF